MFFFMCIFLIYLVVYNRLYKSLQAREELVTILNNLLTIANEQLENDSIDKTSFTLQTTRTSDLGKYKVVATNEFGEVTYPFSVKIEKVASTGNVPNFKTHLKHR